MRGVLRRSESDLLDTSRIGFCDFEQPAADAYLLTAGGQSPEVLKQQTSGCLVGWRLATSDAKVFCEIVCRQLSRYQISSVRLFSQLFTIPTPPFGLRDIACHRFQYVGESNDSHHSPEFINYKEHLRAGAFQGTEKCENRGILGHKCRRLAKGFEIEFARRQQQAKDVQDSS